MAAQLCLLTDEELVRRVEGLPSIGQSKVEGQLTDIGAYFALIGDLENAIRLWDLGDRHLPSRGHGWWERAVRQYRVDPNVSAWSLAEELEVRRSLTSRSNWGVFLNLFPPGQQMYDSGRCAVYVELNESAVLRIRVFDSMGSRVVDVDETQLSAHAATIDKMKRKFEEWFPPGLAGHAITTRESNEILDELLGIFGQTPHGLVGCAADVPAALLHDAVRLVRPLDNGALPTAEDELQAIDLFHKAFVKVSNASTGVDLSTHALRLPLAAEVAARHGRTQDAAAFLQKWHGLATENLKKAASNGFGEAHWKMSRLPALVTLICQGALRSASKLTSEKRAELIARIEMGVMAAQESPLPKLKHSEGGLVLRTDFSDDAAWQHICDEARRSLFELWGDEDCSRLEFVSDSRFNGWSVNQVKEATTSWVGQNHLFLVDAKTIKDAQKRVTVIDLDEKPGRSARVVPSRVGPIFAELSTLNASWNEVVY